MTLGAGPRAKRGKAISALAIFFIAATILGGEAVPALCLAGIHSAALRTGLPASGNKGKMPSPR